MTDPTLRREETAPVVMLHGLMGTARSHFFPQLLRWRARHRLFPIDLPGHGSCPADAPDEYYARVIDWFCTALRRVGPAHVLGVSYLGGTIALKAALRAPELFRTLAISGFAAEVPAKAFLAWSGSFSVLADQTPSLRRLYTDLHGSRWSATLDTVTRDCRASYETVIATKWSDIESLDPPTLIVNGDWKQNERDAAMRYQASGAPVEACLVPGAGHLVTVDQAELFGEAVEDFWRRRDPAWPARG